MIDILFICIRVFVASFLYLAACYLCASVVRSFKEFVLMNKFYLIVEEYKLSCVNLVVTIADLDEDKDEYAEYYGMMIDKVDTLPTVESMQQHVTDLLRMDEHKLEWKKENERTLAN